MIPLHPSVQKVTVVSPLPAGSNIIGSIGIDPAQTGGLALEATQLTRLTEATFAARTNTLGQKAMAGSMPVVLASDQTPVPVSVAAFPAPIDVSDRAGRILGHVVVDASALPAGAATEATVSTLATQVTSASILGQLDVLLSTRLAEATFTSRINTLGQKASAASTPVVIASDQSSIAVTASIPGTVDVSDRAGRLLGHVAVDASALPAGAATEATLALIQAKTDNLDVALSTRASQATVASILAQLDVALSTRASEATLALIKAKTDNLDVALSTRASESTLATRASEATVASILAQLDVSLSTRASQATLASVLAQLDVALSTRASQATVASILTQLDVALSTRASEATLALIKAKTDNLDVALSTRASQATLASVLAQLDVALSTRASEATLALIKAKTDNLDVALSTRASQATLASVLAQLDVALSTRAAAATQTDGTQKSIVRGGAKGTTVATDVTSTAEGTDHQALDVQIYHGGVAKDPTQIRALTNADVVTAEVSKWIGSTAPTVGQKAMAASIPVVLASDQTSIPVSSTETRPGTGTHTAPAQAAAAATILAANAARRGATIVNNPSGSQKLYVYLSATGTVSATNFTIVLNKDDYYEVPFNYTGIITGIWSGAGGGNAQVTEIT